MATYILWLDKWAMGTERVEETREGGEMMDRKRENIKKMERRMRGMERKTERKKMERNI
jgi:hypothetical protein